MATVRLSRREAKGDVPGLCVRCGAPATVERAKTMSWNPPWVYILLLVGLLPFAIVAVILTKRRRVTLPFCSSHHNHWLSRSLVIWLSLGGIPGRDVCFFLGRGK